MPNGRCRKGQSVTILLQKLWHCMIGFWEGDDIHICLPMFPLIFLLPAAWSQHRKNLSERRGNKCSCFSKQQISITLISTHIGTYRLICHRRLHSRLLSTATFKSQTASPCLIAKLWLASVSFPGQEPKIRNPAHSKRRHVAIRTRFKPSPSWHPPLRRVQHPIQNHY